MEILGRQDAWRLSHYKDYVFIDDIEAKYTEYEERDSIVILVLYSRLQKDVNIP